MAPTKRKRRKAKNVSEDKKGRGNKYSSSIQKKSKGTVKGKEKEKGDVIDRVRENREDKHIGDTIGVVKDGTLEKLIAACVARTKDDPPINGHRYSPTVHIPILLERMACGCSLKAATLELGVVPKTTIEWSKKFPSWSMAASIGLRLSEMWWEEQGRLNLHARTFNDRLYNFSMVNRHKWTSQSVQGNLHATMTEEKKLTVNLEGLGKKELDQLDDLLNKAIEDEEDTDESDIVIDV